MRGAVSRSSAPTATRSLIVSHDPQVIRSFCDRALLLEEGRIILMGDAGDVADRYVSMLTRGTTNPPSAVMSHDQGPLSDPGTQ